PPAAAAPAARPASPDRPFEATAAMAAVTDADGDRAEHTVAMPAYSEQVDTPAAGTPIAAPPEKTGAIGVPELQAMAKRQSAPGTPKSAPAAPAPAPAPPEADAEEPIVVAD